MATTTATATTRTQSQSAAAPPPPPTTAPVLEFSCLFTHDIRRKNAKRWHDGYLFFHSFNCKITAYDAERNLLGEIHARNPSSSSSTVSTSLLASTAPAALATTAAAAITRENLVEQYGLEEGNEFLMDQRGVLVQVCCFLRMSQVDVSPLIGGSKAKKSLAAQGRRIERDSSVVAHVADGSGRCEAPSAVLYNMNGAGVGGGIRGSARNSVHTSTALQAPQKHRSLGSLSGIMAKGTRLGKVTLSTKSPFEERHSLAIEKEARRPPRKRQRLEAPPVSARESRVQSGLKEHGRRIAETERHEQRADADMRAAPRISVESPSKFLQGFSSDALQPLSSPEKHPEGRPILVPSSPPAFQCLTVPGQESLATRSHDRTRPVDLMEARRPSPTIMAHNENLDMHSGNAQEPLPITDNTHATSPKGSTLRLAPNKPKKNMLFCQISLSKPSSRSLADGKENEIQPSHTEPSDICEAQQQKNKSQRKLLEERMAKMKRKSKNAPVNQTEILPSGHVVATESQRAVTTLSKLSTDTSAARNDIPYEEMDFADDISILESPEKPAQARLPKIPAVGSIPSIPPQQPRPPGPPVRIAPLSSKKLGNDKNEISSTTNSRNHRNTEPISTHATLQTKNNKQKPLSPRVASARIPSIKPGRAATEPRPSKLSKSNDQASAPTTPQPWSREAFDLFTWRPPGWDEEKWCVTTTTATNADTGVSGGP